MLLCRDEAMLSGRYAPGDMQDSMRVDVSEARMVAVQQTAGGGRVLAGLQTGQRGFSESLL